MAASSSSSYSRSFKYDVFLSFRGEDTRKTFVDNFYSSLVRHQIHTYKDDETLPQGESIRSSLLEAIEESRIAVVILSTNYGGSSWCLEELAHIMKCKEERGLIVMPIFYDVEPSEVRNRERKFGEAFAKQEVKNVTKAETWRKALVDVCKIAGWELKNIANGHESKFIKVVVDKIFDRLSPSNSDVDDDLVGMKTRLNDLKSGLHIGSSGVRMVGIWGIGGSGKTTLAHSLYNQISFHFQATCIVENIQMEANKYGLKTLQEKILSGVLKTRRRVQSVEQGKHMIKSRLCNSKVLIFLDDVNDLDQLQALAGSRKWFGSGSLIIITTRDEHLLRSHKVDEVYRVKLLLQHEAIQLFNMHAYNEEDPIEDYEKLSLRAVSYASGLPLALKVLGSFLCDKTKNEWESAMEKLKHIPDPKVMDILKISYDGLETYQKELFLDIVCFWRWKNVDEAMEILEACDFYPEIGIRVLTQKALINIVHGMFDMHDLVQEMGLYIVRGEHPKNPEKHTRVWKFEEIINMCYGINATKEQNKTEAMVFEDYRENHISYPLVSIYNLFLNMKKLRFIMVRVKAAYDFQVVARDKAAYYYQSVVGAKAAYDLHVLRCHHSRDNARPIISLSSDLRYIDWDKYPATPFPDSFQPTNLVVLKLSSKQEELWWGCKHLPHLKVLELCAMENLLNTPDFDGLPSLQKLILRNCYVLEKIHPSLGNHRGLVYFSISGCYKLKLFPRIVQMKNLKTLEIVACILKDGEIPYDIGKISNLQELNLRSNHFSRLDFSLSQLTQLKVLDMSFCPELLELPELPPNLAILKAVRCRSLTTVGDCHKNCEQLCEASLFGWRIIHNGEKLLQSMLEGKAIENGSMVLRLGGVEVAKGFTPRLLRGARCRVQLPEKWYEDFCGFLICAVLPSDLSTIVLSMNEVTSGMNSQVVILEQGHSDTRVGLSRRMYTCHPFENPVDKVVEDTLVWYVSFGSLRNTTWWDQRYKAISFSVSNKDNKRNEKCSWFRVRLVDKKSRTSLKEKSTDNSHHAPKFRIEDDTSSALTISLGTL